QPKALISRACEPTLMRGWRIDPPDRNALRKTSAVECMAEPCWSAAPGDGRLAPQVGHAAHGYHLESVRGGPPTRREILHPRIYLPLTARGMPPNLAFVVGRRGTRAARLKLAALALRARATPNC